MTTNPVLEREVDFMSTSVRLSNVLQGAAKSLPAWAKTAGLPPPKTIGDLIQWSRTELRGLRSMGGMTLKELVSLLAAEGLSLRGEQLPTSRRRGPGRGSDQAACNLDDIAVGHDDLEDQDLLAVQEVVRCVRDLRASMQVRVLDAACTLLGHKAVFLNDPSVSRMRAQLDPIKEK